MMFRIALVINPFAGLGGSVGLKGSDGLQTRSEALAKGATPRALERSCQAINVLRPYAAEISWLTAAGAMGESTLKKCGFEAEVVYQAQRADDSGAEDTQRAVQAFIEAKADLIVFAGGDGTARDVCAQLREQLPVVGIPAGVKIHSGVYAVTPTAAGRVLEQLIKGELTTLRSADVMDIDEDAFRQGTVKARRYGEMQVPGELEYMQAVKMGGKESDELVLTDIADDIIESMRPDALYIMGSGSTVAAVMEQLNLPNTLLGVDVIRNQELLAQDVTASELEDLLSQHSEKYLVITLIGGQGHIFGRGNQQLSPRVIREIGRDNIRLLATKTKLKALSGRPLRVDTGDPGLDHELSGFIAVTTGYHDQTMVAVKAVD
ncbi:ATP-NAD kinase [Aliidiomarina minuta]|uniref:ATP-NAD kinase n=1 Tax=Aliidiomarina minuta TaxID=880057 RepID=A0A432W5Q5_9GAMM|nr:ATP-NAD kinase family protein [Aliidiomarina minuta]RUO25361.1 ATP-NAD kinase [Aliidiomarina minuta]